MKRIFILIFTGLFICSCSNDDDRSNAITGTWKLMESVSYGQGGISSINYSNKNILYDFRFNGILVVSGGENAGYPDGEYEYTFEKDYLGGSPEGSKSWLVKINSAKWTYDLSDGVMILSKAYVDGPTLKFERK